MADLIRLPGKAHDYVTVTQMVEALTAQRKGIEELIAATFGRYHERYHGTPPLTEKPTEQS